MRDGRFGGDGLQPEVRNMSFEQLLDKSYGDRGGSYEGRGE
jgi:hypothetical protein